MSSSLLLQQSLPCLVRLTLIVFVMDVGGRIAAAFWGVASRSCSKLLAAFLYSCVKPLLKYIYIYIYNHRITMTRKSGKHAAYGVLNLLFRPYHVSSAVHTVISTTTICRS